MPLRAAASLLTRPRAMATPCKRGNIAPRSKTGHCLCADCVSFRSKRSAETRRLGYKAEWARKNKDKVAWYSRKWIEKNKEKRREIEKAWRKKNPEEVAQMNARGGANWTKNNRGKRNAITAARRAAIRVRLPSWADREKIAKIYEMAAAVSEATGIPHEVDHIYPLKGEFVSGLHVAENLEVIPRKANRSKGARLCVA